MGRRKKEKETLHKGIRGARERCLEQLAYRYYLKDKRRSAEQNWNKAEKLLQWVEKRYNITNE
jgi:membrane-bound lytic murein transglycosylase B